MDPTKAFRLLGVSFVATDDEIKAKHHELARRFHPHNAGDPSPEANARMADINVAVDVLMSKEQKENREKLRKLAADVSAMMARRTEHPGVTAFRATTAALGKPFPPK